MRAILTYHSIDDSGSPISVAPEQFRAHVRWLQSGVIRVVPLAELL
ncbi:MAG: polysaccharide deacetylase, partial [Gemmatimonadales bacterium]